MSDNDIMYKTAATQKERDGVMVGGCAVTCKGSYFTLGTYIVGNLGPHPDPPCKLRS